MRYTEVIRAPLWLIAFVYFLFLSMVLSVWAGLGNTPGIITFVLLTAWLIVLYFRTALTIRVDKQYLHVGGAKLEHQYIGAVTPLTTAELKLLRTRDADPSAFLAMRFWSSKAVKVEVSDSRDSTPYWLVSSKNPKKLVEALKN
jgi:hypothetical protein